MTTSRQSRKQEIFWTTLIIVAGLLIGGIYVMAQSLR